jgi:hypothetical protein
MRGAMKNISIAVGVLLVVLIVGIVAAGIFGVLLDVLYIFLMLLAVLMVAATVFQVYWVIMLIRTITTVREEVQPLLSSVQETAGIVKDTAKTAGHAVSTVNIISQLASEFAVGPGVRVVAALLGGQQALRVLFGKGHIASRFEERRKQQMEAGAGGQ